MFRFFLMYENVECNFFFKYFIFFVFIFSLFGCCLKDFKFENGFEYIVDDGFALSSNKSFDTNINNAENEILHLLSGKIFVMGEGENEVIVSFIQKKYLQACEDLNHVGWVGNYWADGPSFTISNREIYNQENEIITYDIINCQIVSKPIFKIKYINETTISLSVISCENFFFNGCGPFILVSRK